MSASDEGASQDLKAGHAPAVKVGGMRVVQHKEKAEKSDTSMTAEEEQEYGAQQAKSDTHHQSLLVSGAATKGDKDFSTQAVKSFHTKPLPTHDVKPRPTQQNQHINQPR